MTSLLKDFDFRQKNLFFAPKNKKLNKSLKIFKNGVVEEFGPSSCGFGGHICIIKLTIVLQLEICALWAVFEKGNNYSTDMNIFVLGMLLMENDKIRQFFTVPENQHFL